MLTTLSLALALASGQSADGPPPPPPPPGAEERRMIFVSGDGASRDADNDGFVSRDEFMAPLADAFGRLDKDGDGRLSPEERDAGHGDGSLPLHAMHRMPMMMRHGGPGGEDRVVVVERYGEGSARVVIDGRPVEDGQRFEIVTADGGNWRERGPMIRHRSGDEDSEHRSITVERRGEGPARVVVDGRELEGDEANVIIREMEGGPGGAHVFMRRPGPDGATVFHGGGGGRNVIIRRMGGPGEGGLDKDGDGKVSEEEFLAPMRDAFRDMDADHSGALEDGEHGPHHD